MTLTIYSNDYDENQDVVNKGMSGKIFLENKFLGHEFKDIDSVLKYIIDNDIEIDEMVYCYQKNNEQQFKKFKFVI